MKFFAFFPGDPKALLQAIILDAEAPQAQGLGDELLVYVAKYVLDLETSSRIPRNALEFLMMVLKTCSIHFESPFTLDVVFILLHEMVAFSPWGFLMHPSQRCLLTFLTICCLFFPLFSYDYNPLTANARSHGY